MPRAWVKLPRWPRNSRSRATDHAIARDNEGGRYDDCVRAKRDPDEPAPEHVRILSTGL